MSASKPTKSAPPDMNDEVVIRDVTPLITTFSFPFTLGGKVKMGARGTLVQLSSGALAMFSPIPLTPKVLEKVRSLGTVNYIIALNIEHHIFLTPWAAQFPSSNIIGMEGLPEKREKAEATKGIKFSHVFSKTNSMTISPEFDAEFEYEYFYAHRNKEVVFLHKKSGTLICADLVHNLPAKEQYSLSGEDASSGLLTRFARKILNTEGEMVWQRRALWYLIGAGDREGFAGSVKKIHNWAFDKVIPCHGDVIEVGGKAVFDQLTEWFREGKS